MNLLREYIRELIHEEKVLAMGMCFPFAAKKAEEWFDDHFTKGGPGRKPKKHPDLNNMDKFKVVHGKVTDKWKKPPKPIVHAWVEMGDLVFDDQTRMTKPDGVPKDVYYDMYQPEVAEEYTAEEAVVNCIKHGEGPWDEDLVDIMKQRDAWMNEGDLNECQLRGYIRQLIMEQEVKFTGILKLTPPPEVVNSVKTLIKNLPENAVPLPDDKFHVTLAHQSVLKPYRKDLKALYKADALPPAPTPVIGTEVEHRTDPASGRESWVVWIDNQNDMRNYVNEVMALVGGTPNPEPTRRFHISIANLTGNPGDSVS